MRCNIFRNGTIAITVMIASAPVSAEVPQLINYQGILKDSTHDPSPGIHSMTFRLYSDSVGGLTFWQETQAVAVDSLGLFNVVLGAVVPVADSAFNVPVYLGTTVASDPELVPRTRLTSVAYAYRVNSINGAAGGSITGSITVLGTVHVTSGGFIFPDGTTQTTAASPFGTIIDYGTSTGSGTVRTMAEVKICYGTAHISSGNQVTITGLPYTSASSYTVVVSRQIAGYNSQALTSNRLSGSSFEINDFTVERDASWLAIGY